MPLPSTLGTVEKASYTPFPFPRTAAGRAIVVHQNYIALPLLVSLLFTFSYDDTLGLSFPVPSRLQIDPRQ